MTRWLLLTAMVTGLIAVLLVSPRQYVFAAGPCGTTHDAVDSEEQQFLSMLASWRATNVSTEPQQLSGALNMAAAWFAEWQLANGAGGGHSDSFGRIWVQRAIDCGYTGQTSSGQPYASGSGEGIFTKSGSTLPNVGPQQALNGMIAQGAGSSGIYIAGNGSLPAKCYGVAVRRSATAVAWVVIIAQFPAAGACPGGSGTVASPSPSPSPTPTRTPTPSPTPNAVGVTVAFYPGWNLVVLPAGPVSAILYRAAGCYRAIYQQQGSQWLRYSPDVPPYANNLKTLNGGTYWVEGTAENCGLVQL